MELDKRLKIIYQDVKTLVLETRPDIIAIESQYIDFRKFSGAILKTVEVTGLVKGIAFMFQKEVFVVHPKSMKSLFSLHARAMSKEAKEASKWYVKQRCRYLPEKLNHNITDAICIGLYTEDQKKL